MAMVLCTGVDVSVLQTRKLILEEAGHTVFAVTDENALVAACQTHSFDVAVIGQTVSTNVKRRIAMLVKQHCPQVKILELYPPYAGKVLDGADSWLLVPVEHPKELAERVDELTKKEQSGNGAKA